MSGLANLDIVQKASDVLRESADVADLWTGTMYEAQILNDRAKVVESLKEGDIDKIVTFVRDLSIFVAQARVDYTQSEDQ